MTRQGEGTVGEFGQEWIRPYVGLHEPVPVDGPATTTATWVTSRITDDTPRPADPDRPVPRTAGTRASHRAAAGSPKRRRALPLTAALAALAGSAAIVGAYAFTRGSDAVEMTGSPPASRLEVVDGEEDGTASPSPDRSSASPTGPERTTSANARVAAGTSTSASPSLPGTSPGTSGTPLPGPAQDSPAATTTTPAPATPTEGPTLRRHDRGPEVAELQGRLGRLGRWPFPQRDHYNRHLYDAVQRFQADHGIVDDAPGVYGPATRRQLEAMTS